jgi:hypothetical protein
VLVNRRCVTASWILASVSLFAFGCGGDKSTSGTDTVTGLPPGTPVATGTSPVPGQVQPIPGAAPTGAPTAMGTAPAPTGAPPTGTPTGAPTTAPPPTAMPTGPVTGPVPTMTATAPVPTTVPTSVPTMPMVVCGDTKAQYEGDQVCILPPPADQGFQLHYGPKDYDDPTEMAKYVIQPGQEDNLFVPATSGNTKDVYFYKRQYRMRPGSHHLILTETGTSGFAAGTGRRLGGSQNTSRDNPQGAPPPENQGIGITLKANDPLTLNLHHFNGSDKPLLKEAWVNVWYVDPATVTQQANELYLFAAGTSVPPGGHTVFTGKRQITTAGRVLSMYGHRHASTVRFSAYRTRAGNRMLVYQDFDWEEPSVFEFNSTVQNPPPDPTKKIAGAFTGDLDLAVGDALEWECEVQNTQNVTITYGQNEALNSEMCILIGDVIGPAIVGFL